MRQALVLALALYGCGGETDRNGGTPAPPPTDRTLTCVHILEGDDTPQRSQRFDYILTDYTDGSREMTFRVTTSIAGLDPFFREITKTYDMESPAAMHAAGSVGPYFAYSHDVHAHFYNAVDNSEVTVDCEVGK